jgi:hypothetical protein
MTDPRVQEVISFLEHGKQTHIDWIEYIREFPNCPDRRVAGDEQHHQQCIDGYEKTLALVKELAKI